MLRLNPCRTGAVGLLTSGYRNVVKIRGPVGERARLVHDWVAALQHNPWDLPTRLRKEGASCWENLTQVKRGQLAVAPNTSP